MSNDLTIADLQQQNLILLEVISGSKAFGLDTETSDTDIKGVFYLPKARFFGLDDIPQVSNPSNDIVYYELGRFVELCLKNNPNILEMLATPADHPHCVRIQHSLMQQFRLELFLSQLAKETFAGYAMTQIKRARGLNKKIVNPIAKERKSVLDFCYVIDHFSTISLKDWLQEQQLQPQQCGLVRLTHAKNMYLLFADRQQRLDFHGIANYVDANDVSLSSVPAGEQPLAYLSFNKEGYSAYCKEYQSYWQWVEQRNPVRYQENQTHGKQFDAKNMMHTIRLLQEAEEIIRTGTLHVRRRNRDELLAIKAAAFSYDQIMQQAEELMQRIEAALPHCTLPLLPDRQRAEALLIHIREELYR